MSIELSNYIKSLPKEYDKDYSLIINSDNVIVAVILKKLINDNVIRNLHKKDMYISDISDMENLDMTKYMSKYIISKILLSKNIRDNEMTLRAIIKNNNVIGIINDTYINRNRLLSLIVGITGVELSILPLSVVNLNEYKYSNELYKTAIISEIY